MIREASAAGTFYPADPDKLREEVKALFSKAPEGKGLGAVSPHAGYAYSGKGAAIAINSLKKTGSFIILGPNHTGIGKRFAVMSEGEWNTPFGGMKIDSVLAGRLKEACPLLKEDWLAHAQEHSIEVQLPFLQYRFPEASFVPVCMANIGYSRRLLEECQELGRAVAWAMREGAGAIASSDFSHHIPAEEADRIDQLTVKEILKLDLEGFFRVLEEEQASVCGFGPIAVLMSAAKELELKGSLLYSSNSGETSGDSKAVVGYRTLGFG